MNTRRSMRGLAMAMAMATVGCASGDLAGTGTESEAITAVCATNTLEGLDVSSVQGSIDWVRVHGSGRTFAYARASGGLSLDSTFAANWPAMRAAGMVRGAYHFFHPTLDPEQQADVFLRQIGHLAATDLPPMIDIETYTRPTADGGTEVIPANEIAAAAQRWIARVQAATGRIPVVYTATFIWSDHVHNAGFANNPLWIADWSRTCPRVPAPWTTWAIQQYALPSDADRSIPGIDRVLVDHDRFNGGHAALDTFVRRSIVPDAGVPDGGGHDASASASDAGAMVQDDAAVDQDAGDSDADMYIVDDGAVHGPDDPDPDADANDSTDASTAADGAPSVPPAADSGPATTGDMHPAGCSVRGATPASRWSGGSALVLAAALFASRRRRAQ